MGFCRVYLDGELFYAKFFIYSPSTSDTSKGHTHLCVRRGFSIWKFRIRTGSPLCQACELEGRVPPVAPVPRRHLHPPHLQDALIPPSPLNMIIVLHPCEMNGIHASPHLVDLCSLTSLSLLTARQGHSFSTLVSLNTSLYPLVHFPGPGDWLGFQHVRCMSVLYKGCLTNLWL